MNAASNTVKKKTTVEELIDILGLPLFTPEQLNHIATLYRQELHYGLTEKKSSLQMLPTHLPRVNYSKLIPGEEAVVIEIGGTNIYAARVCINKYQIPVVVKRNRKNVFIKRRLEKFIYSNPFDFFDHILMSMDNLFDSTPHGLAIIYSFPGISEKQSYGIDMYSSEKLPKNFSIPGISKLLIGQTIFSLLKKKYAISEIPIVVLNDTPAVLLAEKTASIGGVLGTGFNLAISVHEHIYNTESGSFIHIPKNSIGDYIDKISGNPGGGLAEKQISGLYLGQVFQRAIDICIATKVLPRSASANYTTEHISKMIRFGKRSGEKHGDDKKLNEIFCEIANRIMLRSAQLVGTMIGTIITTFPEEYPQSRVTIPFEGSVFWGITNYTKHVKIYAKKIAKKKQIFFTRIEKAGIKGAAVVALTIKK